MPGVEDHRREAANYVQKIPTGTEREYPMLRGLNLSNEEIDFVVVADTSQTAKINQTRVISEL